MIKSKKLRTGNGCKFSNFRIIGDGEVILGDDVTIGEGVIFNIKGGGHCTVGDRSIIGDHFVIEGRDIEIGKEFWSGRYCGIGGGSCMEKYSKLRIGDFGHLGDFSFINTARPVIIGDEVGLGQETKIYTHGAYESFLRGFPVEFGPVTLENCVWCPKAIIMPNVTIGHDTVVGAGAIVTKSLPSGCLAVGIPAKVIKENVFPKKFGEKETEVMLCDFVKKFKENAEYNKFQHEIQVVGDRVFVDGTLFHLGEMRIDGKVTETTEKFRNELRRYGVRFRYHEKGGAYVSW